MATKTQKRAYRFKALSEGGQHREKVEQCYVDSFRKGYSVVEIARIAGTKSAKYIHAALVKHGVIGRGKPGRQSAKIKIPEALDAQLKIREISFTQWCSGWSFDPVEAAGMIDGLQGVVGTAIKRDFPGYYSKTTGSPVDDYETGPGFEKQGFVVHCDWDGSEGVFTAEIRELGIKACGETLEYAFKLARIQRKNLLAIARLEQMPAINTGSDNFEDW